MARTGSEVVLIGAHLPDSLGGRGAAGPAARRRAPRPACPTCWPARSRCRAAVQRAPRDPVAAGDHHRRHGHRRRACSSRRAARRAGAAAPPGPVRGHRGAVDRSSADAQSLASLADAAILAVELRRTRRPEVRRRGRAAHPGRHPAARRRGAARGCVPVAETPVRGSATTPTSATTRTRRTSTTCATSTASGEVRRPPPTATKPAALGRDVPRPGPRSADDSGDLSAAGVTLRGGESLRTPTGRGPSPGAAAEADDPDTAVLRKLDAETLRDMDRRRQQWSAHRFVTAAAAPRRGGRWHRRSGCPAWPLTGHPAALSAVVGARPGRADLPAGRRADGWYLVAAHARRAGRCGCRPASRWWLLFLAVRGDRHRRRSAPTRPARWPSAASDRLLAVVLPARRMYAALTVLLLYAGNLTERELPERRLVRLLGWLFVVTVAGGLLGMFAGQLRVHLAGRAAAARATSATRASSQSLVHPYAAQIMDLLGDDRPRPAAPWGYTNTWGNNFCLLVVWFVRGRVRRRGRRRHQGARRGLPRGLGRARWSISLNRGLWIGLGVAGRLRRPSGSRSPAGVWVIGALVAALAGARRGAGRHPARRRGQRAAGQRQVQRRALVPGRAGAGRRRPSRR